MTHETVSVSVQPVMRSRREFLKLSGMAALSVGGMMFLAGCEQPQSTGVMAPVLTPTRTPSVNSSCVKGSPSKNFSISASSVSALSLIHI